MKSYIRIFSLISVLSGLCAACDSGDEWYEQGEWFNETDGVIYSLESGHATVVGAKDFNKVKIKSRVKLNGEKYDVTSVSKDAFKEKTIQKLYIPPTLTDFYENAFYEADVRELYIEDLGAWCKATFYPAYHTLNCFSNPINRETKVYVDGKQITELNIPYGVETISQSAFQNLNCNNVNFPESLKKIGFCAFEGCLNLSVITLPESIETIGGWAFPEVTKINVGSIEKWTGITLQCFFSHNEALDFTPPFLETYGLIVNGEEIRDVVLGEEEELKACGFFNSNIRSFTAGEGFKTLGFQALASCSQLENVVLPSTIESVVCSFDGCDNLKRLEIRNNIPPTIEGSFSYFIYELYEKVAENCTLYVPKGSLEAYRTDRWWGQFKNIVEI